MDNNYIITLKGLKSFEPIKCMDCETKQDLQLRCDDEDMIVLCKHCIQERIEELEIDEDEIEDDETWEDFVRNDHIEHWRRNG